MRYIFSPAIMLIAMAFVGCINNGKDVRTTSPQSDTVEVSSPIVSSDVTDTLMGYVGDGTSMHNLEFIPCDGDVMELELSDDVDRRANLVVGNNVAVVIRRTADNEMQVLATLDPKDVGLDPCGNEVE